MRLGGTVDVSRAVALAGFAGQSAYSEAALPSAANSRMAITATRACPSQLIPPSSEQFSRNYHIRRILAMPNPRHVLSGECGPIDLAKTRLCRRYLQFRRTAARIPGPQFA